MPPLAVSAASSRPSSTSSSSSAPLWLVAATVQAASFRRYSLPMRQRVTTTTTSAEEAAATRDGFLLQLRSTCGATGMGEVAPLQGLHEETLADAEQQLALLCHRLEEATPVPTEIAFAGGSIRSWLWTHLGLTDSALLPSVRSGLEFAVLNLVAATRGVSLCTLLQGAPMSTAAGCGGVTSTLAGHQVPLRSPLQLGPTRASIGGVRDDARGLKRAHEWRGVRRVRWSTDTFEYSADQRAVSAPRLSGGGGGGGGKAGGRWVRRH